MTVAALSREIPRLWQFDINGDPDVDHYYAVSYDGQPEFVVNCQWAEHAVRLTAIQTGAGLGGAAEGNGQT